MDKVRFGVVGTNFISDWVIAGARQDELYIRELRRRRMLSPRNIIYRIRLPPWRRWRKAR